ncbi:MAG: hypothetical protein QXH24_00040 [Candidatus Bathyarchaeia archaeon]
MIEKTALITIYSIVIFAAICIGYGIYLARRLRGSSDFLAASKALPWYAVAMGVALSPLGSGHTIGMWETGYLAGLMAVWFSICFGALFMPWCFYGLGSWIRRTGAISIPETFHLFYGPLGRKLSILPNWGFSFCIAGIEILCISYAIYGITGLPLIPWCIVISTILSIIYVEFAGLRQLGYLNVIFALIMYIGAYLGLAWLGAYALPSQLGITWEGITQRLTEMGQAFKLNMFASPEIISTIAIPMVIFALFGCGSVQMPMQAAFGAKDIKEVRKALPSAAFVNSLSTIPWAAIGLITVVTAFAAAGPSIGPINLMVTLLPAEIVAALLISLLVANISTSAGHILATTIVSTNDIYKGFINPNADEKTQLRLSRILVIIYSIIGGLIAYMLAAAQALIIPNLMWTSALALPGFFLALYGFWWKRSKKAFTLSWLIIWIVVTVWTFIPRSILLQYVPAWLAEPLNFSAILSFIVVTALTAALPGEKGYFKSQGVVKNA